MEAYLAELKAFLSAQYDIRILDIQPAKRGFFGETWKVETDGGKYFVKIDYWDSHKDIYKSSFPVMERMLESGVRFIPRILYDRGGKLCTAFHGGVLGVFSYVAGENREDYPISELFSRLAQVYRVDTNGLEIEREDFSGDSVRAYRALAARLNPLDAAEARAIRVLSAHSSFLEKRAERLRAFAGVCQRESSRFFLTHGDAGGNCILDGRRFTIIDWDYPKLAPPERDAWFFMHKPQQVEEIESAFAGQGFVYTLSFRKFAYYCYDSLFYYIGEYLRSMLCVQGEKKMKLAQDLESFFTGWIFEQVAAADQVEI